MCAMDSNNNSANTYPRNLSGPAAESKSKIEEQKNVQKIQHIHEEELKVLNKNVRKLIDI